MPLPVDDLNIGDWVIVTRAEMEESPLEFDAPRSRRINNSLNGAPGKIVAISLPFVLVDGPRQMDTLDVRRYKLVRANRRYVREYMKRYQEEEDGEEGDEEELPRRRRKKRVPDGCCPRCGQRLRQRLVLGLWRVVCGDCGYDNGVGI